MKTLVVFVIWLSAFRAYSQISDSEMLLGARSYNKELTQYKVKEFIVNEVLNIKEKEAVPIGIDALTSSGSGELTTVIYSCKLKDQTGFVFGFWNDRVNEFSLKYNGYAFKELPLPSAINLLKKLNEIYEGFDSKVDDNHGMDANIAYKYEDLTFILYVRPGSPSPSGIRVIWNGFDSEWTISNLKLTIKRIEKTMGK